MARRIRYLSLFSGLGGGDLGAKLLGWEAKGYVEFGPAADILLQRVREGNLDDAPIFTDIRLFNSEGWAEGYKGLVDVVVGGPPCQPFSSAGKGQCAEDPRDMWPEAIQVVRTVGPRWCLFENVRGMLGKHQCFQPVIRDLMEAGYTVRWWSFHASLVGAPMPRERVWIYAEKNGGKIEKTRKGEPIERSWPVSGLAVDGKVYSMPRPVPRYLPIEEVETSWEGEGIAISKDGFTAGRVFGDRVWFPQRGEPVLVDRSQDVEWQGQEYMMPGAGWQMTPTFGEPPPESSCPLYGYFQLMDISTVYYSQGDQVDIMNAEGDVEAVPLDWLTPISWDWTKGRRAGWPTLTKSDVKGASEPGQRRGQLGGHFVGANINPDWSDWLMGFPVGWSNPEPLSAAAVNNWTRLTCMGRWWESEPGVPRVELRTGQRSPHYEKRIQAAGNAQVPLVFAIAWIMLRRCLAMEMAVGEES